MIKKSVCFAVLIFSAVTSAQASTYRCDITGWEDYSVEINSSSEKAALFDNDSWSIVPYKKEDFLAAKLIFQGPDKYGDELTITFDFSEAIAPKHTIEFKSGDKIEMALMSCRYVSVDDLWSGI